MLTNASAINGYAIAASDGRLGTVNDFLFDDASWMVGEELGLSGCRRANGRAGGRRSLMASGGAV